jgi:hypothetical protein
MNQEIDVKEATRRYPTTGIHTIRRACRDGRVKARKVRKGPSGEWRIDRDSADRLWPHMEIVSIVSEAGHTND